PGDCEWVTVIQSICAARYATPPFIIYKGRVYTSAYYKSHLNQHFKDYCLKHKILTLCMPPYSSHILQPLDVVCFSLLKRRYSQRVRDLARQRVFYINKEGFLPAFKDVFFNVFTEQNY
ncbi:uncharacterized protein M421DRAFT_388043, partial [Didymella exigua CBS 183.55]